MSARPKHRIDTQFEEQGSLVTPGVVGRIVRLLFGLWLLSALYSLVTGDLRGMLGTTAPTHWTFWAFVVIAYAVTPYVVNLGFTRSWRRKPQYAILAIAASLTAIDVIVYGTWWAPPLAVFVLLWLIYFASHLGLSFVLAALIATPGCEMRSIPHLWTLVSGRKTKEHYCPGVIDNVDRWEQGRS